MRWLARPLVTPAAGVRSTDATCLVAVKHNYGIYDSVCDSAEQLVLFNTFFLVILRSQIRERRTHDMGRSRRRTTNDHD